MDFSSSETLTESKHEPIQIQKAFLCGQTFPNVWNEDQVMDIKACSVSLAPRKMPTELNVLRADQNSHGPISTPTLDT